MILLCVPCFSQTAPASFDVAAVRPAGSSTDGRSHIWSDPSDSHFRAQNQSLNGLLQFAFDLPESRILGGETDLRRSSFDIDAAADLAADSALKALPTQQAAQRKREMVQALLRERFHLISRLETRDLPLYDLVVAKGGSHLVTSKTEGRYFNSGRTYLSGTGYTMLVLAQELAHAAGRVVLDKTGLEGRYDIDLHWSNGDIATPDPLPSLFTVIEEKLGLKLQPSHGQVQVLVIDRLTLPSPN